MRHFLPGSAFKGAFHPLHVLLVFLSFYFIRAGLAAAKASRSFVNPLVSILWLRSHLFCFLPWCQHPSSLCVSEQCSREVESFRYREPATSPQLPVLLPESVSCTLHWQRLDKLSSYLSYSPSLSHCVFHALPLPTLHLSHTLPLHPLPASSSLSVPLFQFVSSALLWQRREADLDKHAALRHTGNN